MAGGLLVQAMGDIKVALVVHPVHQTADIPAAMLVLRVHRHVVADLVSAENNLGRYKTWKYLI